MINFKTFLESIKTRDNETVISSLMEAFSVLYEMPHSETKEGDPIDIHVEDVLHKLGKEKTLVYINDILNKLEKNLPVDFLFTSPEQVNHLQNPMMDLDKELLDNLIYRLKIIKNNLEK